MKKRVVLQLLLYPLVIALMANLGALVDAVFHPEIPYFDEEHLIVGGFSAGLTAILLSLVFIYTTRLGKLVDIRTEDLEAANETLEKNIRKRIKTEDALRESEERYRTLFEDALTPILVIDSNRNYIDCNEAALNFLECDRDELLRKSIVDFIPPGKQTEVIDEHKPLWHHGGSVETEYYIHGKIKMLELSITPVLLRGQEVLFGIGLDITARKKAEQEKNKLQAQLQQAQKLEAIGTLAGGIAHDFNNILMAILGYAELAKVNLPEGSLGREDLEQILTSGLRAKELVKQILAFSRQADQERIPLQLQLIVKETLKLMRASIPSTIGIRQNIDPTCRAVLANPTQIHQLLMNLCTNAAHAMEEKGGELAVELTEVKLNSNDAASHTNLSPGSYVKLTVNDNGHGMDHTTMERIFDPFFTTKEVGKGTGMGLSVVHGIVDSLGGQITVESELGKGTSFYLFFPVSVSEEEAIQDIETAEFLPTGSERILFVDDEQPIVNMGKKILEGLGYKVTAKTSSIDALETFRAKPSEFDLVITDQTMPIITGEALAREILNIRSDMPIILCTGYSSMINEDKAKTIGIREFVMKPVVQNELARTIRKVLDKK